MSRDQPSVNCFARNLVRESRILSRPPSFKLKIISENEWVSQSSNIQSIRPWISIRPSVAPAMDIVCAIFGLSWWVNRVIMTIFCFEFTYIFDNFIISKCLFHVFRSWKDQNQVSYWISVLCRSFQYQTCVRQPFYDVFGKWLIFSIRRLPPDVTRAASS